MFGFPLAAIGVTFNTWALFVGLILILAAQYAYYRTTPPLSGPLRVILIAFRTAAFLALVFLLLDPRWTRQSEQVEPGRIVALIDQSASMSLPAAGWDTSAAPSRFKTAIELSSRFKAGVESRGGDYIEIFFSGGLLAAAADSVEPDGQGTRLHQSLRDVSDRFEGENLSALVLISDGVDTEEQLIRRALPKVPVYTVGVGDTAAPEDVRIKDISYSSIVRIPSRATIRTALHYAGRQQKNVQLRLVEDGEVLYEKNVTMSSINRDIVEDISVEFPEVGRRQFELSLSVQGYDAEEENNRRDIVIEAEKAEARALIVDLRPDWELHFLTGLIRRDDSFDFEIIAFENEPFVRNKKFHAARDFARLLAESDVLILGAVTSAFLGREVVAAIESFLEEKGGGLLVLPGPASIFEESAAWRRLEQLLPVRGSPPFRFNFEYTSLIPGPQAGTHPVTTRLLPRLGQTDWQERSPLLGYYSTLAVKRGAELLLEVGGHRGPAVAYHTVGQGRVAVISAGPLWRWKFLSNNNTVYGEIFSRLLDVLARGENTERFVLAAKKNVFDTGENPVFTAEVFNEKMQPITGIPVQIEISRLSEDGGETPFQRRSMNRESAQSTRFQASIPPLRPGRYLVRGEAELADRVIASRPVEIKISSVSVEFQNVCQDREVLAAIARRSGGEYREFGAAADLSGRLPLQPRRVESITELSLRTSSLIFILILLLLSVEWIVRKRAGMI